MKKPACSEGNAPHQTSLSENSSFNELYHQFLPEAKKLAVYYERKFNGQIISFDDLTQAAIYGLLKAKDYDRFHKKGLSFHSYVLCCMRWAIRDYLKPVTRESKRIDRLATTEDVQETLSHAQPQSNHEELIMEGRMRLSERQREAIRLRFDLDYKLKEVAAAMSISIAAAGKLVKTGLKNLRSYMEPRMATTL